MSQKRISDFISSAGPSKRCLSSVSDDSYASSEDEDYVLSTVESTTEDEEDVVDENVDNYSEHDLERGDQNMARGAYKNRKSSKWDANRSFKKDWLTEYPFIEPILVGDREMVKCNICTWKNKFHKPLQCKKNNIDRHVGKMKQKIIEDGITKYVFAGWEGPEKNFHARNARQYEKFMALAVEKERKETVLHHMFEKHELMDYKVKCTQMRTILHLLQHGRPIKDYPEHEALLRAHGLANLPSSHWSETAGWDFAAHMAIVAKDELCDLIQESTFLSLSLDEVTANDNTSWLCMHLYNVVGFSRKSYFLSLTKLSIETTAESLWTVVHDNLCDIRLSLEDCARKLVCFGADGASVMSGCRTGLGVRLQTSFAPYILAIHCMAHRTNLAFKIMSDFRSVQKVEYLIKTVNQFYCRSPQRFAQYQQFAMGLTDGLKLLKDVDTRWISVALPVRRLCDEYVSVAGACAELSHEEDKAMELIALLSDAEMLLTLYAMRPLLRELVLLIQQAQDRLIFIPEYAIHRKMVCTKLERMYAGEDCFERDDAFHKWRDITSLENGRSFLQYDEDGILCIRAKEHLLPLHCFARGGRNNHLRKTEVRVAEFDLLVQSIRTNMKAVAESLSNELRSRFPRDELLEAMGIVFPNFWNNCFDPAKLLEKFSTCLQVLADHFCRKHIIDGKEIDGILNATALQEQSGLFGSTMYAQFSLLDKPLEKGAVTRLWNKLVLHDYLRAALSEYFKLAELCLTMILGSVEDERAFSSLSFIKNKLRNRLDTNLDATMRLYKCEHSLASFPYDHAFKSWKEATKRRSVSSVHETQTMEALPSSIEQPDTCFWQVTNL